MENDKVAGTSKGFWDAVSEAIAAIYENRKSSSDYFNVFSVLGIEDNEESTHCRFVYELLSPYGSHGQGDAYLKEFFRTVIKETYPESTVPSVNREQWLTGESRADIVISTNDSCYLIEAKINAGEQYKQIERYCKWAESKYNDKYKILFLTKDGHKPETAGEYEEKVSCISFKENIVEWLDACEEISENTDATKSAISQYKNLIRKITGEEQKKMDELNELIGENSVNFNYALEIEKAIPTVQSKKMIEVLGAIRNHIAGHDEMKGLKFVGSNEYLISANSYYQKGVKGGFPSLDYILADAEDGCYVMSVEIEDYIYVGVKKLDNNNKEIEISDKEKETLRKNMGMNEFKSHSSKIWAHWEELKSNNKKLYFRSIDDEYIKLYNKTEYDNIIAGINSQIDAYYHDFASKIVSK